MENDIKMDEKNREISQFSQSGVYVKEDDQDWGGSGINDIEKEANAEKD